MPEPKQYGLLGRVVLCVVSAVVVAACQDPPTETRPTAAVPVIRTRSTQPTTIPGAWALGDSAFPDLAEVVKEAQHNPRLYGLYTWAGEYVKHRESIKKVGFRAIRCGGPFDDSIMTQLVQDDMEVLVTLGRGKAMTAKGGVSPRDDDLFAEQFALQAAEFVARYGPGGAFFREFPALPQRPIRHVEIWNEPNFQYMIAPDGRPQKELENAREALYAKVLPAAYTGIHKQSKEVAVVGFGAGGSSAGDLRFIEHVHGLNRAAPISYDILSTHPYVQPEPPEAYAIRSWGRYSIASGLKKIRATMTGSLRKEDAPVWYTEVGWPIAQKDGGRFAMKGTQVGPDLQAAYVCRLYALSMRLGVSRVFIMFATDTDNYNGGFFLPDGQWRKSAQAVRTMTTLLPAPRLIGAVSDGVDGYFAYRISPGPDARTPPLLMCWNVAGPKLVDLPVGPGKLTVVDMLGNVQETAGANGVLRLEVGPLPIYVQVRGQ